MKNADEMERWREIVNAKTYQRQMALSHIARLEKREQQAIQDYVLDDSARMWHQYDFMQKIHPNEGEYLSTTKKRLTMRQATIMVEREMEEFNQVLKNDAIKREQNRDN